MGRALIEEVAGPGVWSGLPPEVRRVLTGNGPALLAELRAYEGAAVDPRAVAAIAVPVLLVAAADSPDEFRGPADALGRLLPSSRSVTVPGGHIIDPAGAPVLSFVREVCAKDRG